jgi:hypothetical protein
MQQTATVVDQVKVVTQQTATDVDQVKSLSSTSNLINIDYGPYTSFQETNCEKTSTSGSPHRIPQRIITSHVAPITRKPHLGFFKGASFRSGSQKDRSFGFTENVRPALYPTLTPSNIILCCSWLGQKCSLVCGFFRNLVSDDQRFLSVPR